MTQLKNSVVIFWSSEKIFTKYLFKKNMIVKVRATNRTKGMYPYINNRKIFKLSIAAGLKRITINR